MPLLHHITGTAPDDLYNIVVKDIYLKQVPLCLKELTYTPILIKPCMERCVYVSYRGRELEYPAGEGDKGVVFIEGIPLKSRLQGLTLRLARSFKLDQQYKIAIRSLSPVPPRRLAGLAL